MTNARHARTAPVEDCDVVIVGASIAGCTAAILLARAGARVALVERRSELSAFKRVCGHFVQPSGVPTIERLGLLGRLERAGAVRGRARFWTRYGWIDPAPAESPNDNKDAAGTRESLSLRREVLDPILRRAAAETRAWSCCSDTAWKRWAQTTPPQRRPCAARAGRPV